MDPVCHQLRNEDHRRFPRLVHAGAVALLLCLCVSCLAVWLTTSPPSVLQRFISAFHSAVRGAQLFLRGTTKYLVRHKHIKPEQVKMLEEVRTVLVGCGPAAVVSYPILYPILSYLTVSYLISSYPILSSYLIPSHHPSSLHPIPSHFESHSHPTFHPQPQPQPQGSRMFDVMVAAIAFVGFLWQVRSGFSLSFPLNLLLLPFTICEWFLMWLLQ